MNPITTHRDTAYTYLMRFGLPSVGIMYHLGPNPNTNNPSPVYLLFLASLVCHVVVDTFGDPSLPITKIVFHFTGLVGCEALLWILVPVFWKWFVINLFLLLVISLCIFNFIDYITKLVLPAQPTIPIAHPPNPESQQEASASQP
jgi:hypothetical protein